jgi:nanoRNase/pAp phosphatase (c-di-AMP/oligoRNAs hydrolase)
MSLNTQELQAATKAIEQAERLLIIPHANVDPDGLSSALSCHALFKAIGKDCTVICPDTLPESLRFLPQFDQLSLSIASEQEFVLTLDTSNGVEIDSLRYTVEDNKVNIIIVPKKGRLTAKNVTTMNTNSSYDLIVVVDTADLSLLGSFYTDHIELFTETPVLNIDHHISNTRFGQLQLIDATCASATEVLYMWFQSHPTWKTLITPDIATLLLTGLITDTRSFQNPNTTPKSLEVAANLLDLGARQQEIIQHIYKTKPLSTLKIWGRALNRIQVDAEARIVWSSVSKEDLQEMGATSKETAGILDELISTVPDADVHVLFTEIEEGGFKASLRSSPAMDVNIIAGRLFGGGGHARAAGFRMKEYSNFQLVVVECVKKIIAELLRQREEDDAVSPVPKSVQHQKTDTKKSVASNNPASKKPSTDVLTELGSKPISSGTDIVSSLRNL